MLPLALCTNRNRRRRIVWRPRIGIELSPDACRIVEMDRAPRCGERRQRQTRVRSFAVCRASGPDTDAELRSLRGRPRPPSSSGTPPASIARCGADRLVRSDARRGASRAGCRRSAHPRRLGRHRAGRPDADRAARRPVVVSAASAKQMAAALQPLVDAGIRRADGDDAGRRARVRSRGSRRDVLGCRTHWRRTSRSKNARPASR